VVRDLGVGQKLEVRGPSGRFNWTGDDRHSVLLIGAGRRLVPLVATIRYAGVTSPVSTIFVWPPLPSPGGVSECELFCSELEL
jgi:NAD(P)H-flavin reductase